MNDNVRLFHLYEALKDQGRIKTYVELAEILETNKAGINDLKSGRKKVSIENLRSMINSYEDISSEWLLTGKGNMWKSHTITSTSNDRGSHNKEIETDLMKEVTKKILEKQIEVLSKTISFMQAQLEEIGENRK